MAAFNEDLKSGKVGEIFVEEKLKDIGYIVNSVSSPDWFHNTDDGSWFLKETLERVTKEIKTDFSACVYGNIAIETYCNRINEPSGIIVSTADEYVFSMPNYLTKRKTTIGICNRQELVNALNDESFYVEKDKPMGDMYGTIKAARGFLVRIEKYLKICKKIYVVDGVPEK